MTETTDLPSATSTGVNSISRTLVVPFESIGRAGDPAATSVVAQNSMMSLLAGIADGFSVGSAPQAITNTAPRIYPDLQKTLGAPTDTAATDTGAHSAISFMKAILATAGST